MPPDIPFHSEDTRLRSADTRPHSADTRPHSADTPLSHSTDTPVLLSLPFTARRVVVAETTNALFQSTLSADPGEGIGALSTLWHVSWMMEILGQAFALPLEDINVVGSAVAIYTAWLLEPAKRPPAIQRADSETQQQFLQTIVRHASLLFQPRRVEGTGRPQMAALAGKHVELCKSMLRALAQIAVSSQHGPDALSTATWKVLLSVLLNVSDKLLRSPLQPYCYLTEELGETLLAIFIELWLRSQIFSARLWGALGKMFPSWTHRIIAVAQWSSVSLALTQRITKLLYGQGTDAVVYTVNANLVTIELADQYAVYAWYQVLQLIDSPRTMAPQIFFRSVLGVERLAQVFHSISPGEHEGAVGLEKMFPDANTLLHLFGAWLFEAVAKSSPDCAEGRAQAFGILCRIVTRPQRRSPILPTYLHQFYAAVIDGLRGDLLSLVFIAVNCEDIFALGLPGVRVLVRPFVLALRRIVPDLERPLRVSINMDDLRRACYKLLCTLFGFCNHFATVPIEPGQTAAILAIPPQSTTPRKSAGTPDALAQSPSLQRASPTIDYAARLRALYPSSDSAEGGQMGDTRYWILDTIVASLLVEHDPGNLRYLVNTLAAFAFDDNAQTPGLISIVLQVIAEQLCSARWSVDVSLAAVEILRQFAPLQDTALSVDRAAVRTMVLSMCALVQSLIARNNLPVLLRLIAAMLDCMLEWILGPDNASAWFASDAECQAAVIQLLCGALAYGTSIARKVDSVVDTSDGKSKTLASPKASGGAGAIAVPPKSFEAQLAIVAEIALARLLVHYGSGMINPFYPRWQSTLLNECALLGDRSDATGRIRASLTTLTAEQLCSARYFLLNKNTLACFVEREEDDLVVLLRSICGRFSWESSELFTLDPSRLDGLVPEAPSDDLEPISYKPVLADSASEWGGDLEKPLLLSAPVFNEAILQDRFSRDERRVINYNCIASLAQNQANATGSAKAPSRLVRHMAAPASKISPKDHLARLFLTHTGLGSLDGRERAVRLPSSVELLKDLQALDDLPEREIISCTVLFLRSGCQMPQEILEEDHASRDFANFVYSLGWPLDSRKQSDIQAACAGAPMNRADPTVPHNANTTDIQHAANAANTTTTRHNGNAPTMPYYANSAVELYYHVPALGHTAEHDLVTVLWIEDLQDMLSLPSKLQTQSIVFICISPLPDEAATGLYRIRIMVTSAATAAMSTPQAASPSQGPVGDAIFLFGPLLDGMIVRREALGRLVRETVISACLFGHYNIQNQQRPMVKRAQMMQNIVSKYRTAPPTPSRYYNELIYNAGP